MRRLQKHQGKGCGKRGCMKFKMMNGKDIQCVVTEEEMKNYGLNVDDIFSNTEKAQYFLNEILDMVEEKTGCMVGDGAKTVQAVCLPGNAIALTFSDKVQENETKARPMRKMEVLEFESLAETIVFCRNLHWEQYDNGILCKEKKKIYLIVDLSRCNLKETDHFLSSASEFARNVVEDENKAAYVSEHAAVLIPERALQVLVTL